MKRPNNCKTCGKMEDGGTMSSFGKAFSAARKQGLKVFDWNGKSYTTELKEEQEVRQSPIKQAAPIKPPITAPTKKEGPMIGLQPSDADGTRIGNMFAIGNRGPNKTQTLTKKSVPAPTKQLPSYNGNPRTSNPQFTATDDTGNSIASMSPQKPVTPIQKPIVKSAISTKKNTPAPVDEYQPTKLQSGMVTDKGTNMQYLIQNGKVVRSYPVLTGANPNANSNPFTIEELEADPKKRATPTGDYYLKPEANLYGRPGFTQAPIADKQGNVPNSKYVATHFMFNPEERAKYFEMTDPRKRDVSFGCTNVRGEDIDCATKMFPKGDTLTIADSRTPHGKQTLAQYNIPQEQGGIMQSGGTNECTDPATGYPIPCGEYKVPMPSSAISADNVSPQDIPYLEPDRKQSPYLDRIEEGISQGVLEPKKADGSDEQESANQQYWNYKGIPEARRLPGTPLNWKRNLGIGMMGVRSLLSEISGRVARSRQNQYDYEQQSALGMMNPMPTNDYQPNPYSLYSKYGGKLNLKKKQVGGLNQTVYDTRDDMVADSVMRRKLLQPNLMNLTKTNYSVTAPNLAGNGQVTQYFPDLATWEAHMKDKQYISQQISGDKSSASASVYGPQKYGGLLHAKLFGNKFSNGATYKFSDSERFDKVIVSRSIVPDLILRKNWGNKRIYRGKNK